MKAKQVQSLEHLKKLASQIDNWREPVFCSVFINFGFARSSKEVSYDANEDKWTIYNLIDNTTEESISTEELYSETNIIKALESGNLYYWDNFNEK